MPPFKGAEFKNPATAHTAKRFDCPCCPGIVEKRGRTGNDTQPVRQSGNPAGDQIDDALIGGSLDDAPWLGEYPKWHYVC